MDLACIGISTVYEKRRFICLECGASLGPAMMDEVDLSQFLKVSSMKIYNLIIITLKMHLK